MNNASMSSKDEAARSASADSNLSQALHALGSLSDDESGGAPISKPVSDSDAEIFDISPITALELLCENVDRLARSTSECVSSPLTSVASVSNSPAQKGGESSGEERTLSKITELHCIQAPDHAGRQAKDDSIQQHVLVKRFLSKREPPIPLKDYLLRLHRFCPMSTAVYLATSVYITKMVAVERILFVTPKNVHRLVLAGLRVAVKALEDLNYPHSRFAKVGGVSERELLRLEISFCFLVDFELRVDAQMLMREVRSIQMSMDSRKHVYTAGSTQESPSPNE